jgi:hypothetical protein
MAPVLRAVSPPTLTMRPHLPARICGTQLQEEIVFLRELDIVAYSPPGVAAQLIRMSTDRNWRAVLATSSCRKEQISSGLVEDALALSAALWVAHSGRNEDRP